MDLQSSTSGVEALLRLGEERVHGVIVDLELADIDGLELIRRVRGRPAFKDIKLVATSASNDRGRREAAMRAGAAACLQKPADAAVLLAMFAERLAAA